MRIYVASKFERKNDVKAFMRSLRLAGHTIVGDWTAHSTADEDDSNAAFLHEAFAKEDRDSVESADALVLLHDERCKGGFTELGIAIGYGVQHILVVGGEDAAPYKGPIFYFLPEVAHVATEGEALDLIADWTTEDES